MTKQEMVGLYLYDHLLGAEVATGILKKYAKSEKNTHNKELLIKMSEQIESEKNLLTKISENYPKNFRLRTRNFILGNLAKFASMMRIWLFVKVPLRRVEILDILISGVNGKICLWKAIDPSILAPYNTRPEELINRAKGQLDNLSKIHHQYSVSLFS